MKAYDSILSVALVAKDLLAPCIVACSCIVLLIESVVFIDFRCR